MTYSEFQAKWYGGRVDIDGVYGYQCVDLAKQNMLECQGVPNGAYGNAIDYWTNTHPNILQKYMRVSGSDAKMSDLIVINATSGNPYGHIGVADGQINSSQVVLLEQNGSTGNGSGTGGDAIRLRWINRSTVAGLLRPITNQDGGNVEKVNDITSLILQHGIIARNGLRGRAYALDGSTGYPWVGEPLTNAFIQSIFDSPEAVDWRDTYNPASVNDINERLDSIPFLEARIAELEAELANCSNQSYVPVNQLYIKEGEGNVSSYSRSRFIERNRNRSIDGVHRLKLRKNKISSGQRSRHDLRRG